jgi:hypothetical protein
MAQPCSIWSNPHHIFDDTCARHGLVYAKGGKQSRRNKSKGWEMRSQWEDTMKEPSTSRQSS